MKFTTYKNSKVILKSDEGVVVWANGHLSPKVHIEDKENRYYCHIYEGVELGDGTDTDKVKAVLIKTLNSYMQYRGTRTCWTLPDAWYKKWERKKNAL